MAKIIDQQAVNERLQELRMAAKILSEYAGPIYKIAGTDATFDQLSRIHFSPDHFKQIGEAKKVLDQCVERVNKRFSDEQKISYLKAVTHVRGRFNRKRTAPEWFTISEGTVRVNEKLARKLLEAEHAINASDENATLNGWAATFTGLVNTCPNPGLKRRLGRFALMMGREMTGMKIQVKTDGNLEVVDLQ